MRTLLRILAQVVIVAVLLAGTAWFGGRWYLARSVLERDGQVRTAVAAPVEVTFDAMGVPQIWAKTDADAYYAIGWLHASDRLFQMEMLRRLVRGELAEIFGQSAYESDLLQRRLAFVERADPGGLTPEARRALERYVAGVNAWTQQARPLPPEFVLLRLKPRPWTLEDCLTIAGYQTWYAHQLKDNDRSYQKVINALGVPGSALALAGHPWSPPTVPSAGEEEAVKTAFVDEVLGATGMRVTGASNSWAVSPARSSTGAALHAADPHLGVDQAPGLWYLAGMHSEEGLNVVGATYAGSPFVVMGHNGTIAWSFTVASVDLVDYFGDRPRSSRREEIQVQGETSPRLVEVEQGQRGVMLSRNTSIHWAGFDFPPSGIVNSSVRLQGAKNFDEFRRAVTGFGALDANWIYSDRSGNIGTQLGAPLPLRDYVTYLQQRADDPRTVWRGYRPLEETPFALNPPQGFLASCNNRIVPGTWPYDIPGFYDPYRIMRATAQLKVRRTPDEMRALQRDLVSVLALRWKRLAAEGALLAGFKAEAQSLAKWDGAMVEGSRDAALFAFWWRAMARAVFEDELGKDWESGRPLLDQALTISAKAIDDRRTTKHVETAREISARAMRLGHSLAKGRTWGQACTLQIRHPLSRVRFLEVWLGLSPGTFPAAGDPGSLNANFYGFDARTRTFRSRVAASMRFVLDWADVDSFSLTGVLGQSGNPFSPHYEDFLGMSRKGDSWNVPFTREKVFARKASLLRLEPE